MKNGFAFGAIAGAIVGVLGSMVFVYMSTPEFNGNDTHELRLGPHEFINPLIDCPQRPDTVSLKKNHMQERLHALITKLKSDKTADAISVGFRDLIEGAVLRMDVDEPFLAASLLKLPIVMTIYKKAMTEPEVLTQKLVYEPGSEASWSQFESAAQPLTAGARYSVEDLIRRMLVDSDNAAAATLLKFIPPQVVIDTLKDMGVVLVQKNNDWWITVGEYGSLFRILYNSTFLNQEFSNRILKILTDSKLKTGLVSGVEPNIAVAHKFGERKIYDQQQFHDCGIVYYSPRPYLLCIMTRGHDIKNLESAVAQISKVVFEEVR